MFERFLFLIPLSLSCSGKDATTGDTESDSGDGSPPTALITAPTATEVIPEGAFYIARGTVDDPDDAIESLVVQWFIGDEEIPRECPQGIHPDSDGLTLCDVSFSVDKPLLRLRVEDNDGNSSEDTVSVNLEPATAPTVVITEPVNNSKHREGELIDFVGTVSDGEDRPDGLRVWIEDNGTILVTKETGLTVDAAGNVRWAGTLRADSRTIRFWAEDTSGRKTSAETLIQVVAPQAAPDVFISTPESGSEFVAGDLIVFNATVGDEWDEPNELTIQWSSNRDGVLGVDPATSAGVASLATDALSVGEHLITIEATDSDLANVTASITVQVVDGGDAVDDDTGLGETAPVEDTGP